GQVLSRLPGGLPLKGFDMIRLDITIPPSINNAYYNSLGRGRVSSKTLDAWKKTAGWEVQIAKPAKITGHYTVKLLVPEMMRGDVDGRLKFPIDLLVSLGVTPDDRHCVK